MWSSGLGCFHIGCTNCQVGLFGDWLERHKFGKFVVWESSTVEASAAEATWIAVAVERDGKVRIPSAAALNQYVLVQVTLQLQQVHEVWRQWSASSHVVCGH